MGKLPPAKSPLKLAFLGCGFATSLHSKTLSGFKDRVDTLYASRDIPKAERFKQKFAGSGSFRSYEAAIASPAVDVVLIATPPSTHLDLSLAALRSGKHVILEKPPLLKSDDFSAVREAQQASGRFVYVAENYFYKPLRSRLRQLIATGVIGEVMFVHINALKMQEVRGWRGDTSLSGGGALFEGGVHWINFIANLGLKVKSATGFRPGKAEGPERSILIAVEFEEGAVGSLYYSWETPSLFKGLRLSKIYGRKGSITFESNGLMVLVRGSRKQIVFPGLRDIAGYKAMFRDFLPAIAENRPAKFNLDLAERDIKLVETIYASLN